MRKIYVIAHDIRSTHNVGSLMRTAEGLGITKLYLTGITPYPTLQNDPRLPHQADKLTKQINKTALDAQHTLPWEFAEDPIKVIDELKADKVIIAGLEQTKDAKDLSSFSPPDNIALVLGNEVNGLPESVLKATDVQLVIPMFGSKESFNVVQAAAMALYRIRFN